MNYGVEKEIIYITKVFKFNLCEYNDAYIFVRSNINIIGCNLATEIAFRNCVSLIECITKIDRTTLDDAEDFDLVMPIYNLIEYISNYSDTTGSLRFNSKDEAANFNANAVSSNNFKSLKYKTRLIGNTGADKANGILRSATIAVPLKHLRNFWRSIKMPLIKCKVYLKQKWSNRCIFSENGNDNIDNDPNNIMFTIKDTELYVPVVTL